MPESLAETVTGRDDAACGGGGDAHAQTAGTYVVDLRFWRGQADGTPAGQQRLTRTITLSANGQSLTSTIKT